MDKYFDKPEMYSAPGVKEWALGVWSLQSKGNST